MRSTSAGPAGGANGNARRRQRVMTLRSTGESEGAKESVNVLDSWDSAGWCDLLQNPNSKQVTWLIRSVYLFIDGFDGDN